MHEFSENCVRSLGRRALLFLFLLAEGLAMAAEPRAKKPEPISLERSASGSEEIFPLFPDPGLFLPAIRAAETEPPVTTKVAGLIVPHHLLAVGLIARIFRLASAFTYRRIVILCPDHFHRGRARFAVCARDLGSCLGRVPAARKAALALARHPSFEVSNLFSHEHAVQGMLPFLAHHFPGVPLLAVAISNTAQPEDWIRLAVLLRPLCGSETLVIQSTDFSHGLVAEAAHQHDLDSLRVLASEDPCQVLSLRQPVHVDSLGAMFVQMMLQKTAGAHPLVIDNRNSQEYAPSILANTTSYIIAMFGKFNKNGKLKTSGR